MIKYYGIKKDGDQFLVFVAGSQPRISITGTDKLETLRKLIQKINGKGKKRSR